VAGGIQPNIEHRTWNIERRSQTKTVNRQNTPVVLVLVLVIVLGFHPSPQRRSGR
jgi:hypothetical protein